MHLLVRCLALALLVNAAHGQPRLADEPNYTVRINKLVIESNNLPDSDRYQLIRLFQQKTYSQSEIDIRLWYALRDRGYYKPTVEEPKFSFIPQASARKAADVTVHINPGPKYRIGEIRIENSTVFSSDQLRKLFSLQKGDLFNLAKVLKGLEDIRKIYATKGYVNFLAIPELSADESHLTVDLAVQVDEGRSSNFGHLYLEGVEPHPGAGHALQNAWKPLEGKRYNSLELQRWLQTNHANWKVGTSPSDAMKQTIDPESMAVNVTLTQWPH